MSNYLTDVHAFEKAINRGYTSTRSKRLDETVHAVKLYCTHPNETHLEDVRLRWDTWQGKDPKEFNDRGMPIARDFRNELNFAASRYDGPEPAQAPHVAINRYRLAKQAGKLGMGAASAGISAAQFATGTGTTSLIAAGIAGTAVSATGIGLVAAAGALTIGTSVLAATSAVKTHSHVNGLMEIFKVRDEFSCQEISQFGVPQNAPSDYSRQVHTLIGNRTLPYIIDQKNKKFNRKVVSAVPVVGLLETARATVHKAAKWKSGELGKRRRGQAEFLAEHFISCNCGLASAIVAELYSVDEMEYLRSDADYDQVTDALAQKMKSV